MDGGGAGVGEGRDEGADYEPFAGTAEDGEGEGGVVEEAGEEAVGPREWVDAVDLGWVGGHVGVGRDVVVVGGWTSGIEHATSRL